VAQAEHVGFIDLNEGIARRYDALGHDAVVQLFPLTTPDEHTHTNWAGAELNAQVVVAGLKALGDPRIAAWLKPQAPVNPQPSARDDARSSTHAMCATRRRATRACRPCTWSAIRP
jgi:hypothetical protein